MDRLPDRTNVMSRLLDQVRAAIRTRHYSPRTEASYVAWIRRYIEYHQRRHPAVMGAAEVGAFLSHLAVSRRVSASTQNQALNALVFLYKQVLQIPLTDAINASIAATGLRAVQVGGRRFDCGSKAGFLEATVHMALRDPDLAPQVRSIARTVIEGEGSTRPPDEEPT